MKIKKFCALIEIIRGCEEVLKLDSMDEHEKNKNLTPLNGQMQRKPRSYSCNAQKGS